MCLISHRGEDEEIRVTVSIDVARRDLRDGLGADRKKRRAVDEPTRAVVQIQARRRARVADEQVEIAIAIEVDQRD